MSQKGTQSQNSKVEVPLQISLIPLSQSAQDLLVVRDEMSEAVKYVESVLTVNHPLLEPAKSWKGALIPSCDDAFAMAGITHDIRHLKGDDLDMHISIYDFSNSQTVASY
jgi:hypothetical protein